MIRYSAEPKHERRDEIEDGIRRSFSENAENSYPLHFVNGPEVIRTPIGSNNAATSPYHLCRNLNLGPCEVFPPRRHPRDGADQADDSNRSACIVHVRLVDGVDGREIERDGGEEQEQETEDVEPDAESAEGVRTGNHFHVVGEIGDDAGGERHCVGEVLNIWLV